MKNKWKVFFLCLFFGWLGVHRYYEGKIKTGVLYTLTFGIFCIGWILDLWSILIRAASVEKQNQYTVYLDAITLLQQNGYELSEFEREWCNVSASVKQDSKIIGRIFVVSDPRPTFLPALIGAFSPSYKKNYYYYTSYASMGRILKIAQSQAERAARSFYYYWPDDSLVGGWSEGEEKKWLNILKSAIEGE